MARWGDERHFHYDKEEPDKSGPKKLGPLDKPRYSEEDITLSLQKILRSGNRKATFKKHRFEVAVTAGALAVGICAAIFIADAKKPSPPNAVAQGVCQEPNGAPTTKVIPVIPFEDLGDISQFGGYVKKIADPNSNCSNISYGEFVAMLAWNSGKISYDPQSGKISYSNTDQNGDLENIVVPTNTNNGTISPRS